MCPFSTKNYAKMSIFLVKIRSGWGLCPQTPGCGPSLPNPGCATGQAYEVLPSEILGWLRHCIDTWSTANKMIMQELNVKLNNIVPSITYNLVANTVQ